MILKSLPMKAACSLLAIAGLLFTQTSSAQDAELLGVWTFEDGIEESTGKDIEVESLGAEVVDDAERGKVVNFEGGGIHIPNAEFLNAIAEKNQLSVAFWQCNVAVTNSSTFWFANEDADSGRRGAQGHVPWGNGAVFFDTMGCCGGGDTRISYTPEADPVDTWLHWVFVKDGDDKRIYVDGELDFDGVNTNEFTDQFSEAWLGSGENGGNIVQAKVDDFAIYNGVLTDEQIKAVAEGGSLPGLGPVVDTDEDGMPDDYEEENGLNPEVNDADEDKDGDGLTNLEEFEQRSDPNKKDTDDDGLEDNVETNTGVWVSATDTGTSPTRADTDRDGLLDGVETNTGSDPLDPSKFISKDDTGTSPLNKDTDGDGPLDGAEVAGGTNPLDPNDKLSVLIAGGKWTTIHAWSDGDQIADALSAEELVNGELDGELLEVKTDFVHFHDNVAPPYLNGDEGDTTESLPYPLWGAQGDDSGFGDRNDFAILSTGQINVKEPGGIVTFVVNSDDGFILTIDDDIVGEAGNRGRGDTIMEVDLSAGIHDLSLLHWERGGGAGITFAVHRGFGAGAPAPDSESWELVSPIPETDTDGDGIPDTYEIANELNPEDAGDKELDKDGDGLSNFAEFQARLLANNPDTDGDGLSDGVETNTRTWVSAENTGTNPKSKDTDKDGLEDGAETNTGTFVSAADSGTDPNKEDTDEDGLKDNTEITVCGSDPTDKNSNECGGGLLACWEFEGDATDAVSGVVSDDGDNQYVEGKFGQAIAFDGTAAVHIEDASFMNVAASLDQLTVVLWHKNQDTPNSSSFWFNSPSSSGTQRGAQAHIPWSNREVYWDTVGCCAGGAERVNGDPEGLVQDVEFAWDDEEWHHWVFWKDGEDKRVYVDGEMFLESSGGNPLPDDFTDGYIGGDGGGGQPPVAHIDDFAVIGGALTDEDIQALASGDVSVKEFFGGTKVPFQILSVTAPANNEVNVTWDSKPNASYTVEFSDALQDWIELTDGVESEGEETTFTDDTITDEVEERYYRIRQE